MRGGEGMGVCRGGAVGLKYWRRLSAGKLLALFVPLALPLPPYLPPQPLPLLHAACRALPAPAPNNVNYTTMGRGWVARGIRPTIVFFFVAGLWVMVGAGGRGMVGVEGVAVLDKPGSNIPCPRPAAMILFPIGTFAGICGTIVSSICGPVTDKTTLSGQSSWFCSDAWFAGILRNLVSSLLPSVLLSVWQAVVLPIWFYTCAQVLGQARPSPASRQAGGGDERVCFLQAAMKCCSLHPATPARLAQAEAQHFSFTALDLRCAAWFFWHDLINVFIGGMLGGSIMWGLRAVINDPSEGGRAREGGSPRFEETRLQLAWLLLLLLPPPDCPLICVLRLHASRCCRHALHASCLHAPPCPPLPPARPPQASSSTSWATPCPPRATSSSTTSCSGRWPWSRSASSTRTPRCSCPSCAGCASRRVRARGGGVRMCRCEAGARDRIQGRGGSPALACFSLRPRPHLPPPPPAPGCCRRAHGACKGGGDAAAQLPLQPRPGRGAADRVAGDAGIRGWVRVGGGGV